MKINYKQLDNFLTNFPDEYWEKRSISLKDIYDGDIDQLTLDDIDKMLDIISLYEKGEEFKFSFKMFIPDNFCDTCYLLEMEWK